MATSAASTLAEGAKDASVDIAVSLLISDDGVGISDESLARSVEHGHIGLTSIRTKILASGGDFRMRAVSPGTEISICLPLRQAASATEIGHNTVTLVDASQLTH
jgi:two-component system NarL family sensor kinase